MFQRFIRLLALTAALSVLTTGASTQALLPVPGANPVHNLTLDLDESGQIALSGYGRSAAREPLSGIALEQYAEAVQTVQTRDLDLVSVQLIGQGGNVVYQTIVTVPRWIRGEFAHDPSNLTVTGADGSNIDGVHLPWRNRTFNVSVPVIEGADRVAVSLLSETRSAATFDLNAAAAQFGTRSTRSPAVLVPLAGYSYNQANRIDIVILGDGYTAAQQALFAADAKALADGLFSLSPYSDYRNYFNVAGVFGDSAESGADQPPYQAGCSANQPHPVSCCPIKSGNDTALNATWKNTRYDSTYCYSGISRLLVATDYAAMYADADFAYAGWDEIFVIVNDIPYGGSGGAVAAVARMGAPGQPLSNSTIEMVQHESGHSLIRLDDEYNTYTPGYPPCSDMGRDGITTACRPNVTDQTTAALIKWSRWIAPGMNNVQPANSNPGSQVASRWLGAHYQTDIYYRSCHTCTMRALGAPFGPVASEQLPIVLYQGGWEGQNSYWTELSSGTGIDIIEPGTATPDPAAPVAIPSGASQTFQFKVLSPSGGDGKNTRVRWTVNGTLVREGRYANLEVSYFTFTPVSGGAYTVVAEAIDLGSILHPTQTSVSKTAMTWTVSAEGYAAAGTELIANGGFEMPSPANPSQPDAWRVTYPGKSKRVCNPSRAATGICSYMMQGTAGLTAKLKQVIAPLGDSGDAFSLSGQFDTYNLTANFSVTAKIVFANGTTKPLKLKDLPRDKAKASPYLRLEEGLILSIDSANVTKIVVLVKFPGSGGKVYIDELRLLHYDEYLSAPPPAQ
jgi:hypothetical protein